MVWVKSAYAEELAVLVTWLSLLLPWSVSYASNPQLSLVAVRFLPGQLQYIIGVTFGNLERPLLWVWQLPGFESNPALVQAYLVWLLAAAVYAVALLDSLALYFTEDRIASLGVDHVRTLGVLLGTTAVLLSGSLALLWQDHPGLTVPVGVLFLYAFGGLLLSVDRT
ncbi:hypothetical protein BRC83_08740 [Halobacteriales archaeon QS_1_68_17]|nr:MAG: hypothetical protein BRC83_08740 [Halobacteriales archaeon QS_1_68_17]